MRHSISSGLAGSLFALLTSGALAQAPAQAPAAAPAQQPQIAVTKVDGTEGLYIFRNGNHQSIFVVTKDGVIATDPVAYGRPNGAKQYIDEIRKITQAPIKYVIYSHHHLDHIAGGKAFKDAGAKFVAHKVATERLKRLKDPHTVIPDESVGDGGRTIKMGGTELRLVFTGRNHSDSSLVMFLPKEKVIFAVDFNSLGAVPSRLAVNDSYPGEWEESLKKTLALAWDRQIPGHPGPGGRLGTRQDMEQQIAFMTDLNAEVKKAALDGKCFDPASKDVRLPKYATMGGYDANIEWNIHRLCSFWGRGIN
ncbi:MAG: MBL fold metallo-hydrolase [Pseudolabrys sp.]|nr:MBL fold metallo-hydrolase [Pseudolabrys sp.]